MSAKEEQVKISVSLDRSLHARFKKDVASTHGFIQQFLSLCIQAAVVKSGLTIEAIIEATEREVE